MDHHHHGTTMRRRTALLGLATGWTFFGLGGPASLALASAATGQRFVVVILRGALDWLAAVSPYGDRDLQNWRPDLDLPPPGTDGGLLDLGGFYGLHPALSGMHDMYKEGELLPVHAVAGPYRSRSHFEAQDFLESGTGHLMASGWLNRAVGLIPTAQYGTSPGGAAIAMGFEVPLILRGPSMVGTWAKPHSGQPDPDLYARIAALGASDPLIGPAIGEGLRERHFERATLTGDPSNQAAGKNGFVALASVAGTLLAAKDGPRIAALEIGGWDTHAGQKNRLPPALKQLDQGIVALKQSLGDAWKSTIVLMMTEFGRTVRANGTGGTDHGTGSVAFLLGGLVAGGRVMANWPGLSRTNLFQDRDLQPTLDIRSLAQSVLIEHLNLPQTAMESIFPDQRGLIIPHGLLRA